MKKQLCYFMLLLSLLCGLSLSSTCNAQQIRTKNTVLTVYINNSGTTYKKELDKKVNEEYIEIFKNKSIIQSEKREVIPLVDGSGARYFIYMELLPFVEISDYNFVYHNKAITSSVFIWIIDLKTNQDILRNTFSLKEKDSTGDWFIGDKSVALKSLRSMMFKIGEHISAKLPL